jgi:hypothetical protein
MRRAFGERKSLSQPPYVLDKNRRDTVLAAIRERCEGRGWTLLAPHIRTTHVHSYVSRRLNFEGFDDPDRKRWARHGSTRWLWKEENLLAAIKYVINEQGQAMAVLQLTALMP